MDKVIKNFGGIIVLVTATIALLVLKYTGVLAISLVTALSPLIALVILIAKSPLIIIVMVRYRIKKALKQINNKDGI